MALLNWNDSLSVGVKEIDGQHGKLVDMVNQLHEAMKQGKADTVMMGIIQEMKRYAANHFATEERLMTTHNFPGYAAHKAEHQAFVGKVEALEADLKSGKVAVSSAILDFLSKWLVNHIKGTDMKYSSFLNAAGVH